MRTIYVPPLIIAAILFTSCSRSTPSPQEKKKDESILRHDKDGDGKLSHSEIEEMNSHFLEKFDKDGDGQLGTEERKIARKESKVRVSSIATETSEIEGREILFGRLDLDSNGFLNERETGEVRWKAVSVSDKNRDGKVSLEEWERQHPAKGTN